MGTSIIESELGGLILARDQACRSAKAWSETARLTRDEADRRLADALMAKALVAVRAVDRARADWRRRYEAEVRRQAAGGAS